MSLLKCWQRSVSESSTGNLVNRDTTSKLTMRSPGFIFNDSSILMKWNEFFTWCAVFLCVDWEVLIGAWRVDMWGHRCYSQWALVEWLLYVPWAVRTNIHLLLCWRPVLRTNRQCRHGISTLSSHRQLLHGRLRDQSYKTSHTQASLLVQICWRYFRHLATWERKTYGLS